MMEYDKNLIYALMDGSSDLSVIIDIDGNILEINDAAVRRFELDRKKLINSSLYNLLPADYMEFRRVYIDIVLQSKESHRFEDEYKGFFYNACIYPIINDKTNKVEKLAVFATDKTIYKKNEDLYLKHSMILSTVQNPMAFIDRNLIVQIVNNAYELYFKKSKDEIYGKTVEELYGEKVYNGKLKDGIAECLNGKTVSIQEWFFFPDGSKRFMLMTLYPYYNKQVISGVVINSTDITKQKMMEDELTKLSVTDQLTGIYNRVKFATSLTDEINRLKRYEGKLSIIMFDIDFFKKINDTFGHDVGDEVLKKLTSVVQKWIRSTDIFSRWGGEEFMLLLPHTDIEKATMLAERIRAKIENKYFKGPNTVTCSFGVTEFTQKDDEESFTKRVDEALYKSKRTGRNKVTVF